MQNVKKTIVHYTRGEHKKAKHDHHVAYELSGPGIAPPLCCTEADQQTSEASHAKASMTRS